MKRFFLSLLLVFFTCNLLFSQRDTDHWFAPMAATTTAYSSFYQGLYFSTDSTTPFDVTIYTNDSNGNSVPIGTVNIKKGDPKVFEFPTTPAIPNVNMTTVMVTTGSADKFTKVNKGIYTHGEKPYFVNYRFGVTNHGEILTSKGKAGIGKLFYTVVAPLTYLNAGGIMNFTTGIMATEDNTTVNVSGYASNVQFTNGTTGATNPTITVNLNKGESYIIDGSGSTGGNATGFIGSRIESDKPVSVTNGNFNGQFAILTPPNGFDGSDIIMDQSVPVDRLGNEFVLVKGNGDISEGMEDALVVATEDNTEVYVNNEGQALFTLNAGQWKRVNSPDNITFNNKYIDQGNGHYNLRVKTSKNAYVYQLLAGINNSNATVGFNYIPPLNCFLPRKIDEIAMVNILPPTSNTVKLNILTEAGATVTVNDAQLPVAQGPYPVSGTTAWVSYSVPNATGNMTVASTKAVTAGIAGGSGAVGYGGYFAGFSSIPVIAKKTGECVPGIVLEVDDSYETYQWFRNGVAITGATANTYTPTQSGNFTVKVTMGTCPPVTTPIYKVYTCLKKTTKELTICGTTVITPAFTSSTQTPVPNTVTILTAPTHGNATLNTSTGAITYTPTAGYLGPDKIVYKFCGNDAEFIDCEEITLNLTVVPFVIKDATIEACQYDTDPYAEFDLTTAPVTDYPLVTKKFYKTMANLTSGTNMIADPAHYQSLDGIIYVKVTTNEGCTANAQITLVAKPIKKSPLLVDQFICIDARTSIDAGPGYDSYQWNTGATTPSIQAVSAGQYTVVLGKNGCFITQVVNIKKAPDPVITQIDITNNTATVIVNGGKPPYQYSVDGVTNWQESNVFTGLSRGQHTFYVKDFYNCDPISVEVTVPNLVNAITPNGDNVNDYIDYRELGYKENLVFVVYDRYGNKIFTGDKFNNYTWDGRHYDKKILTGTYWYHITWNEPNKNKTPIKYTGWILVKNID
ncbi:gliding motility-associated C-terminal domain-containing protein [Chryseobacterium sp. MYb264]|uniref:T9SS type B sorting domain-containing protein n=1 Tax=Chryseobacterium sp. MYb264 TaxID=2745153 RepID=UPI002E0E09D4|nr:gliding motility-associated C-terminal domain-containing protein [Chryseobacterium sp. MYb264]